MKFLAGLCWEQSLGCRQAYFQCYYKYHNFISKKNKTKEHQKERDRLPALLHNMQNDITKSPAFSTSILWFFIKSHSFIFMVGGIYVLSLWNKLLFLKINKE